jgi:hypothetical protein
MKTTKFINLKVLSILALVIVSFSSCLKDPRYIDYSSSPPLVEFPLAAFNVNKTIVIGPAPYAVSASLASFDIPVTVNLASPELLKEAVTFTVAVDNSTLTGAPSTTKAAAATPSPNTANITTYAPLPAADYTFTGYSGTIPAGQRTATFNVTIKPSLIGSSVPATSIKNYALRLVIKSSSVQISNFNVQTYLFQLPN